MRRANILSVFKLKSHKYSNSLRNIIQNSMLYCVIYRDHLIPAVSVLSIASEYFEDLRKVSSSGPLHQSTIRFTIYGSICVL